MNPAKPQRKIAKIRHTLGEIHGSSELDRLAPLSNYYTDFLLVCLWLFIMSMRNSLETKADLAHADSFEELCRKTLNGRFELRLVKLRVQATLSQ